jgi:broad specificity phosphatase PhoE
MEDPGLTDFGILQSATLGSNFQRMDKVTHIITSPCRRTIMTAKHAFRPLLNRGMEIHLINFLKERGSNPCNNGSPVDVLRSQFKDLKLNDDALEPNWQNQFLKYDSRGDWRKAALTIRKELLLIGMRFLEKGEVNKDGNVEMVVVSHGGTLRIIDGTRGKCLILFSDVL